MVTYQKRRVSNPDLFRPEEKTGFPYDIDNPREVRRICHVSFGFPQKKLCPRKPSAVNTLRYTCSLGFAPPANWKLTRADGTRHEATFRES